MVSRESQTFMFQEAESAPQILRQQLVSNRSRVIQLVDHLKEFKPRIVVTCGRGSSDQATLYGNYLFETLVGIPTSSAAPSIASVYDADLQVEDALYIAISQSGKSPDIVEHARKAKAKGACVVALVNVPDSPLADLADWVLPLGAGEEISVAATKTYITSLTAMAQLVAYYSENVDLQEALEKLPDHMEKAWGKDWSEMRDGLLDAKNLFLIGRGVGFPLAQEVALKFKETCGLHAEAYSAAEVKHGPMAIVGEDFPVLVFTQQDKGRQSIEDLVQVFSERESRVFLAGNPAEGGLPSADSPHELLSPMVSVQSFYRFANSLSLARGYNPDVPPHLNKVNETV